jgi:hypothetical protein
MCIPVKQIIFWAIIIVLILVSFSAFFLIKNSSNSSSKTNNIEIFEKTQFIYLNQSYTDLYYDINHLDDGIYLDRSGLNEKVANVNNGTIYLLDELLKDGALNPYSFFLQRNRFNSEIDFQDLLYNLQQIHGARIIGGGLLNFSDKKLSILKLWPQSSRGYKKLNLKDLSVIEKNKELSISFPELEASEYSGFSFLYLHLQDNYLEVRGYKNTIIPRWILKRDYVNLAKIYPDGIVWMDTKLVKLFNPSLSSFSDGEYKLDSFYIKSFDYSPLKWQTNYKFEDYLDLRKRVADFYA